VALKKLITKTLSGWRSKPAGAAAPEGAQRGANRLLPLREAAQIAYDEADGTTFRMNRGKSPEQRLEIMATYLANNAVIFGVKPPAEAIVHIPMKEFRNGSFKNGGVSFRRLGETEDTYVRLAILEDDLRRVIRKMCAGG